MLPATGTDTQPNVISSQPPLSAQEVERICKAFILLLHAPLKKEQEKQSNGK
jgi:hypothetical protein